MLSHNRNICQNSCCFWCNPSNKFGIAKHCLHQCKRIFHHATKQTTCYFRLTIVLLGGFLWTVSLQINPAFLKHCPISFVGHINPGCFRYDKVP